MWVAVSVLQKLFSDMYNISDVLLVMKHYKVLFLTHGFKTEK